MNDLDFVRAYLAKHVELLTRFTRKTDIQLKFAHDGLIDEPVMLPDRWFTDEQMGRGTPRRLGAGGSGGLDHPPVSIFVYGFVRDNLELFRKPDGSQTT